MPIKTALYALAFVVGTLAFEPGSFVRSRRDVVMRARGGGTDISRTGSGGDNSGIGGARKWRHVQTLDI